MATDREAVTRSLEYAVVLDQNMMRRQELRDFISNNSNIPLVIPDTAFVEMVKSDKWEYTFRRSFETLIEVADRCFMSLSVQDAREFELEQENAIDVASLIPMDFTMRLRGAIEGSQSDGNAIMIELRKHMPEVRSDMSEHELNAPANRDELVNRVAEARARLSKDEIRACRQDGELGRQARRTTAVAVGNGIYFAHLTNLGVSKKLQQQLWLNKSMNLRWAYMLAHQAIYWLGIGGLEGMSEKNVLNDILDQDYVLVGSYVNAVLSQETTVNLACEDLKEMLSLR